MNPLFDGAGRATQGAPVLFHFIVTLPILIALAMIVGCIVADRLARRHK